MSVLSPIEVPQGKHVVRVINGDGDADTVYDPTVEAERIAAKAVVDAELPKKPALYAFDAEGGGYTTREFDSSAQTMVVFPQNVGG